MNEEETKYNRNTDSVDPFALCREKVWVKQQLTRAPKEVLARSRERTVYSSKAKDSDGRDPKMPRGEGEHRGRHVIK